MTVFLLLLSLLSAFHLNLLKNTHKSLIATLFSLFTPILPSVGAIVILIHVLIKTKSGKWIKKNADQCFRVMLSSCRSLFFFSLIIRITSNPKTEDPILKK